MARGGLFATRFMDKEAIYKQYHQKRCRGNAQTVLQALQYCRLHPQPGQHFVNPDQS